MKKCLVLLSVGAALLARGAAVDEYKWISTVAEGDFNDGANWSKTADAANEYPQAGNLSFFYNMTGSWKVNIPAGMKDDASKTLVRGLKSGSRLVFDATKAPWRKVCPVGTSWYDNKILHIESGNNAPLLGINADTGADGRFGFVFNGLMTFDAVSTGSTLTFAEGSSLDLRDFEGAKPVHSVQMFRDDSTTSNAIVFKPNTTSRWYKVSLDSRSNTGCNTLRFEGGEHRIDNDLNVKNGIGQASTGVVEMVSGKLLVAGKSWFDQSSELRLSGDGEASLGSQMFWPYNDVGQDKRAHLRIDLKDTAKFTVGDLDQRGKNSDVVFRMGDRTSAFINSTAQFSRSSSQSSLLDVSGQAGLTIYNLVVANGQDAQVTVDLSGDAQFVVTRQNDWAGGANSRTSFTMRDQTLFKQDNGYWNWNIGKETDETAVFAFNLIGGTVAETKAINAYVAPESQLFFAGTTVRCADLNVKRTTSASAYRPNVKLTAGTVTVSGAATFDALDATGGTLVAKELTGGNDAEILFDGAVVSPYADGQEFVHGIATAKVGAKGLLLDAVGKTAYVNQAFTDATADAGRVCIQGTGTVKARQASEHATTELAGGTLGFDGLSGAVEFGKNIVFAGGTLDLAGTGGLVCQSLSVGEARGYVSFPMDTDGEYPLFTVTDGVELSVVRRIRVANRTPGRSYTWKTTETDAGTVCSVVRGDPLEITVEEGTETFDEEMDWGDSVSIAVAEGAAAVVTGSVAGDDTLVSKTGSGSLTVSGANKLTDASWVVDGGRVTVTSAEAFGTSTGVTLKDGTFEYAGATEARVEGPLTMAATASRHPVILKASGDLTFTSAAATHGELVKTGAGTLKFDVAAGSWNLGVSEPTTELLNGSGAITLPLTGASPTGDGIGNLRGVSILEGTLEIKGVGQDKSTVSTQNSGILGANFATPVPAKLKVSDARFNFGSGSRSSSFCFDLPAGAPAPSIELTNAYLYADACRLGGNTAELLRPEIRMTDSTFYNHYNVTIGSENARPVIVANNSKLYSTALIKWDVYGLTSMEFTGSEAMFGSTDVKNDSNNAGRIRVMNSRGVRDSYMKFSDGARLVVSRGLWYLNDDGGTVMQPTVFDGGIFEVLQHASGKEYYSQMAQTATQCFQADAKGLTVRIAENTSHRITFPIRGVGKFTKDGKGTLKLLESREVNWGNIDSSEIVDRPLVENGGGLEVAEGTLVLNGGLVAGTPAVTVAAGAVLDLGDTNALAVARISGGGTVRNGVLTGPVVRQAAGETAEPQLAFEGLALPANQEVLIDFSNVAETDTKTRTIAVAALDATCRIGDRGLDVSGWKAFGVNVPTADGSRKARRRLIATFSRDAETGLVTVAYAVKEGLTILIR